MTAVEIQNASLTITWDVAYAASEVNNVDFKRKKKKKEKKDKNILRPVHRWKIRKLSLISIFLVLVKGVYPNTHRNGRISSRFSQVSKNHLNKPSKIKLLQAIMAGGNNGAGKIKQGWTGRGDVNISFCVIVDHYCQTLFLEGKLCAGLCLNPYLRSF